MRLSLRTRARYKGVGEKVDSRTLFGNASLVRLLPAAKVEHKTIDTCLTCVSRTETRNARKTYLDSYNTVTIYLV